ncbi:MAG: DUF2341 domain-containing protein [Bacteroidota bacterium]
MTAKRFLIRLTFTAWVLIFTAHASLAKWNYSRVVTIDNNGSATANAVVKVQLYTANFDYSKAAANGADVRFSTKQGDTGDNGLSYWIEEWNTTGTSTLWIKISKLKKGDNIIYMRYGNTEAKAQSNGEATFLFFDDFGSSDYAKKWTNVSIGDVQQRDGILKLKETDGQIGIITANFEVTGKMIIRARYQREGGDEHWTAAGIGGWNHFFCFGDHTETDGTGTNWLMLHNWASLNNLKSVPIIKSTNGKITKNWRTLAFWNDGKTINGMQDDNSVGYSVPAKSSSKLALRTLDNDAWDNFDYVAVSAYNGTEPSFSLGDQVKN